jgi:hypothetical protein
LSEIIPPLARPSASMCLPARVDSITLKTSPRSLKFRIAFSSTDVDSSSSHSEKRSRGSASPGTPSAGGRLAASMRGLPEPGQTSIACGSMESTVSSRLSLARKRSPSCAARSLASLARSVARRQPIAVAMANAITPILMPSISRVGASSRPAWVEADAACSGRGRRTEAITARRSSRRAVLAWASSFRWRIAINVPVWCPTMATRPRVARTLPQINERARDPASLGVESR